ncbi:MAG: TadE/TadG family type IV pilus assembly protein [Sphingomonadaceae bacterium]
MNQPQPLHTLPVLSEGFLTRLGRDKRGNTLAMITMAIIPLVAMSGSAVDIGRAYLVKTRLQQACDAGVLAGRRAMGGSTYGFAEEAQANTFFNTNMSQTFAGATNIVFDSNGGAANEVVGSATARVPTTLMKLFYQDGIDLAVNCSARLDISNTDVVMVLDVTGSMDDCADGSSACRGPTSTTNKMANMRAAVIDFYDTIRASTGANTRFRLGFVPYSQQVNLGLDPHSVPANQEILPAGWTVTDWTYQSRVANMTTPLVNPFLAAGAATTTWDVNPSSLSQSDCTAWGAWAASMNHFSGKPAYRSGTAPVLVGRLYENNVASDWSYVGAPDLTGTFRSCRRPIRDRTYTGAAIGYGFTSWSYLPVTVNVAAFRSGAPVDIYTGSAKPPGTTVQSRAYNMIELVTAVSGPSVAATASRFQGCMEERDTVAQATYPSIPVGALDLNHTRVPDSNESRWRPVWEEMVYDRDTDTPLLNTQDDKSPVSSQCPAPASKLRDLARAQVVNYVNTLRPVGATFHSIGMAWGNRFASATGIWGAENQNAPNGQPITRHIIFMTDGAMNADPNRYSSHGFEEMDRRAFGTSGTVTGGAMNNRHDSRFIALCNAARGDGASPITVWTVAFGTANTWQLQSCADPGRSFQATNAAQLRAQFQAIASQIAQLRLSQ